MNMEQQLYNLVYAGAEKIKTTNEYAPGKNYETDIGDYIQEWMDKVNSEIKKEVFEIRDPNGEASDDQEPIQNEIISWDFVVGVKKGNLTAQYLRSARADIYRMIGSNIDAWRAAVNGSLRFTRVGFTRDITHEKEIYGELLQTITIEYIQTEWLLED